MSDSVLNIINNKEAVFLKFLTFGNVKDLLLEILTTTKH